MRANQNIVAKIQSKVKLLLTFIADLNLGSFKSIWTVCKSSKCFDCFSFPFIVSKSVTKCEKSKRKIIKTEIGTNNYQTSE